MSVRLGVTGQTAPPAGGNRDLHAGGMLKGPFLQRLAAAFVESSFISLHAEKTDLGPGAAAESESWRAKLSLLGMCTRCDGRAAFTVVSVGRIVRAPEDLEETFDPFIP